MIHDLSDDQPPCNLRLSTVTRRNSPPRHASTASAASNASSTRTPFAPSAHRAAGLFRARLKCWTFCAPNGRPPIYGYSAHRPQWRLSARPIAAEPYPRNWKKTRFQDLINRENIIFSMTRKDQILIAIIALVGALAMAWATYAGPAHAEEKRWELAERTRCIELAEQRKRTAAHRDSTQLHRIAQTKAADKKR